MKVFIVSDMEGVAGIVKWAQTDGAEGDVAYHEGRKLYTEEINAAVRGAKRAGATEIVVMDCHGAGKHWSFNSLIPEDLDPDCEFVVQQEWTEYTEFLEQGCDELQFNGTSVGETGINAALCGAWGCPVLLVTGDDAVCGEATELLGTGLTTVSVKRGLGRFSARNLTPARAREAIEAGAAQALANLNAVKPYDPGTPCEIRIEFTTPDRLVEYRNRRGVEQVDGLTLVSRADDWWTAWSQFYF
ncbi:MAG: M55 family metallopeptidase [Acidobacteria bacterium]|nr:M55 family metallopeptidase [Acidobacteriota bacterium]